LILRKIIKIVANRCHILKLKCTNIDYGSAADPAGAKGRRGGEREGKERG